GAAAARAGPGGPADPVGALPAGTASSRLLRAYGRPRPARPVLRVGPIGNSIDYLAMNTTRAPFSDPRLRRAVNYAIDRRALAAVGGWTSGVPLPPAQSYLPPATPGYR